MIVLWIDTIIISILQMRKYTECPELSTVSTWNMSIYFQNYTLQYTLNSNWKCKWQNLITMA